MKQASGREDPNSSPAEHVFADYLQRVERGENISFAALVADHAELKTDLERLMRHWESMQRLLACVPQESLADELERRYGPRVNPGVTLDVESVAAESLLERIAHRSAPFGRYRIKEEIGRGGMGVVLRVWDDDLRRHLAMKVVKEPQARDHERELAALYRFLEEAQVTGQLDHPGIVPVHELGLAPDGFLYFTMKLVKGDDLEAILKIVPRAGGEWNEARLLGVLLKVCEALAYAHDRGVIHRDLKPGNIMVGRYGEVFVMDWGLARILGREDRRDLSIRPLDTASSLQSERRDRTESDPNSPLYTIDGKPLGTPAYMPPEQAAGNLNEIGPWSDVYAIGAMLYHLLTGHRPYVRPTERVDGHTVLRRVLDGPPEAVSSVAPRASSELVAICEKAMARSPHDRYASMNALADDLRAYLEGRVVRAHRKGPLVELRKWVRRNRTIAASLATSILVLIGASLSIAWIQHRRSVDAHAAQLEAERNLFERSVAVAVARAGELWPIHPNMAPAMRQWLKEARQFVGQEPKYRAEFAKVRGRGQPADRSAQHDPRWLELDDRIVHLRTRLEAMRRGLEQERVKTTETARANASVLIEEIPFAEQALQDAELDIAALAPWIFDDAELQEKHDRLAAVVRNLEVLSRPRSGLVARIESRCQLAETVEQLSVQGAAKIAWENAIASIADEDQCPAYHGVEIEPQLGLVPLRQNPDTGLWEFWHVVTGTRPTEKGSSDWTIAAGSGMVLILVPSGTHVLGASSDRGDTNYDPAAQFQERPEHSLELDPFFLSRYEMTQGQWRRATGQLPCRYAAGDKTQQEDRWISAVHPVEQVSWSECDSVLWRLNLGMPTESQWEAAARGGTSSPYWWGLKVVNPAPLNLLDQSATSAGTQAVAPVRDGFIIHAPVDAFGPNRLGFQSILGNVFEWCRDWYVSGEGRKYRAGSGICETDSRSTKAYRGGGFQASADLCRVTVRFGADPHYIERDLGVRAARAVERR